MENKIPDPTLLITMASLRSFESFPKMISIFEWRYYGSMGIIDAYRVD